MSAESDLIEGFLGALDERIAGRQGTHTPEQREEMSAARERLAPLLRSDPRFYADLLAEMEPNWAESLDVMRRSARKHGIIP